jgi:putative ATP-binding cassette transporter
MIGKHADLFWHFFLLICVVGVARSLSYTGQSYVQSKLLLDWRRWLTSHLVEKYLSNRTYFEITVDQSIDNPDERMQEEVDPFCSTMANLPQLFLGSFFDMSVQAAILWNVSRPLFWAISIYSGIKTAVILAATRPTIKQQFEITVAEADLRYGLLHVRDNAETVAFYRGEHMERRHIEDRLSTLVKKKLINILYGIKMSIAYTGFGIVWGLLPMLFLAPLYFKGTIQYGTIAQAGYASMVMLQSLMVFVNFLPILAGAAPRVIRLAEIQEKFEFLGRPRVSAPSAPLIELEAGPRVALENVSLQTPGGELRLVKNLTLSVGGRRHLIIVGQTGVGKSSLLRSMAGLWTRGTGRITMPPPEDVLFLPQRPYMILASLRDQILYPNRRAALCDEELESILERVNLPQLARTHGGLSAEKDWGRVLSLGEQQRIAFARILASRPKYVFLDEATSALDIETERHLYALLEGSSSTFISVGHRPTIMRYHRAALRLYPDGSWELSAIRRAAKRILRGDDEVGYAVLDGIVPAAGRAMQKLRTGFQLPAA